jgi:hypothetical protein
VLLALIQQLRSRKIRHLSNSCRDLTEEKPPVSCLSSTPFPASISLRYFDCGRSEIWRKRLQSDSKINLLALARGCWSTFAAWPPGGVAGSSSAERAVFITGGLVRGIHVFRRWEWMDGRGKAGLLK